MERAGITPDTERSGNYGRIGGREEELEELEELEEEKEKDDDGCGWGLLRTRHGSGANQCARAPVWKRCFRE